MIPPVTLKDRLSPDGPKRILSLDGGGIRGALTLGFLGRLEKILRDIHANPQLRLCEYFDLIGGTSTGAIIAAALAIGKTTDEIREQYLKLGGEIFGDRKGFMGVSLDYRYNERPLAEALKNMFGEIRIGDEGPGALCTGLCIVTKRLDTGSTWPVINHPNGPYYQRNNFYLRDLVRASTAAPTYFIPEIIDLGQGNEGTFVDGGLSMMNNPSLQLFLIATLAGYPFHWNTGENNLQIVSLGTGHRDIQLNAEKYKNPKLWQMAGMAPDQFMHDAQELVESMMQLLSHSPTARDIDRIMGKMETHSNHIGNQFSYLRYNISLDKAGLSAIGMEHLSEKQTEDLTKMDDADNRFLLSEIGERAADKFISREHFAPQFLLL